MVGCQDGCERRIEVVMKMQKKCKKSGGGSVRGCQGGCERKIEVIVKKQKETKNRGRGWFGAGGVGRVLVGSKVGVRGCCGVWGCEPRIEGIVQCT